LLPAPGRGPESLHYVSASARIPGAKAQTWFGLTGGRCGLVREARGTVTPRRHERATPNPAFFPLTYWTETQDLRWLCNKPQAPICSPGPNRQAPNVTSWSSPTDAHAHCRAHGLR